MAEAKTRVVFGFKGTLVDGSEWRPGAKELLKKLQTKNVVPVVWTTVQRRTARNIYSRLDGFHSLVREVFTKEQSAVLLSGLAKQMTASGVAEKVELAKRINPNDLIKIPAAVGSSILVDSNVVLRQEAREFGSVVIDPAPLLEDTSPDQWAGRVAVAIFATLQD